MRNFFALGTLSTIAIISFSWMMQYSSLELSIPIQGSFWDYMPSAPRERAQTFLPQTLFLPPTEILAAIVFLVGATLLLARHVYRVHRSATSMVFASFLLSGSTILFLAGVFIGSGTTHFLASLEEVQERAVTVTAREVIETQVRSKGDYPTRTFLILSADFPFGKYLWISPQVSWEPQFAELPLPSEIVLRIGKNPKGGWVLLDVTQASEISG